MQITFFSEMRIEAMHFALQSYEGNVGNSRYNKATDFSKSNIGVSL